MSNSASGVSLLDRMGVAPSARSSRGGRADRHTPYDRSSRPSSNETWKHDMFAKQNQIEGGELGARMAVPIRSISSSASQPLSLQKALAAASGKSLAKDFSIRGASGVTVEVRELVKGTTAADVEAIFKRCGTVLSSNVVKTSRTDSETVQVKFENQDQAAQAVSMFNKQAADGRILEVEIISNGFIPKSKSVDALFEDSSTGGSKLRSDAILATDSRAQVMTSPSGTPSDRGARGARGKRRGRGRGGRGGAGAQAGAMVVD